MDLTRLSPAPWFTGGSHHIVRAVQDEPGSEAIEETDAFTIASTWSGARAPRPRIAKANAEFIVLARAAFAGDPEALAWWEANRVRPQEDSRWR